MKIDKKGNITLTAKLLREESPTGKAFLISILDETTGEEIKKQWFPHSKVTLSTEARVTGEFGEMVEIVIPKWLADNEGITDLVVSHEDQLDAEYGQDDDDDEEEEDEPIF